MAKLGELVNNLVGYVNNLAAYAGKYGGAVVIINGIVQHDLESIVGGAALVYAGKSLATHPWMKPEKRAQIPPDTYKKKMEDRLEESQTEGKD